MIEAGYTIKEVVDNYRITLDEEDAVALLNATTNIISRNLEILLPTDEAEALHKLNITLAEAINKGSLHE